MTKVVLVHRIMIHAPLEFVFEYVSDLSRHPEWSSGRLRMEALTPGPVAVGKEYISHGEFAIQKDRQNTVRIADYEHPHRFGFIATDPGVGDVAHVFTFALQGGAVLITRTMTLSLNPILAVPFRFLMYPLVGRPAMDRSLKALKLKLEEQRENWAI